MPGTEVIRALSAGILAVRVSGSSGSMELGLRGIAEVPLAGVTRALGVS